MYLSENSEGMDGRYLPAIAVASGLIFTGCALRQVGRVVSTPYHALNSPTPEERHRNVLSGLDDLIQRSPDPETVELVRSVRAYVSEQSPSGTVAAERMKSLERFLLPELRALVRQQQLYANTCLVAPETPRCKLVANELSWGLHIAGSNVRSYLAPRTEKPIESRSSYHAFL
jgi:hypothetical protein